MSVLTPLSRFWEESGGHLVVSPNYIVEEAGPEYLRLTRKRFADIQGKNFFDTLEDRDSNRVQGTKELLRSALTVAKEQRVVEKISAFRSDVRDGHDWQERWWELAVVPVVDRDVVRHLVIRLEDVTTTQVTSRMVRAQRISSYILYLLVLLAVGLGFWKLTVLGNQNHTLAIQNRDLIHKTAAEQQAFNSVLLLGRKSRFFAIQETCDETDHLVHQLRRLIIAGTVQTKPFSKELKALGFPSYQTRLRQATKEATSLHTVNCFPITPKVPIKHQEAK